MYVEVEEEVYKVPYIKFDIFPNTFSSLFDFFPQFLSKHLKSGLGSRSRSEPGVFGSLEPEPLEKKQGAGTGSGSSALREDKKHKEIVL